MVIPFTQYFFIVRLSENARERNSEYGFFPGVPMAVYYMYTL